jgi:uncharacterized protein (DUF2267 family)
MTPVESTGGVRAFGHESTSCTDAGARYVYGVIEVDVEPPPVCKGLDGSNVYLIIHANLGAIVHDCQPRAYSSDELGLVKDWVEAHNRVLDTFMQRYTVVPYTFNTIIHDKGSGDPEAVVREWLAKEASVLGTHIERLRGKAEYGTQILWDSAKAIEWLAETDPEVQQAKKQVEISAPGAAYMYREKLQRILRSKMETAAATFSAQVMSEVRGSCCDIRVEKNKRPEGGLIMIANWSCLVRADQVEPLGEVLDRVAAKPGFQVRYTGPWPAYSFVG